MMEDEKLNHPPPPPQSFSHKLQSSFLSHLKRNHLSRSKTLTLTLWTLDEYIKLGFGLVV